MGLSFLVPILWFLGLFGLIPLFLFIYHKETTFKKSILGGYVFGIIFIGSVLIWIFNTYPLDWAGVTNETISIVVVIFLWFLISTIFSLFITLWSVSFYKLKQSNLIDILLAPSLWILFEYARAFFTSILWSGKSSLIGAHWTLGFLGYIFSENEYLLSFASIGGVYLVSFIIVLINISLFWILFKSKKQLGGKILWGTFLIALVFILGIFVYFTNKTPENKNLNVAIITGDMKSSFKTTPQEIDKNTTTIGNLIRKIPKENEAIDVVILPEDTRFLFYLLQNNEGLFLNQIFYKKEILLIDSGRTKDEYGNEYSTIGYYNTKSGITFYDKTLLVPGGEYMPDIVSFFLKIFNKEDFVASFKKQREVARGNSNPPINGVVGDTTVGALFCSEIYSQDLYQDLTRNNTDVLVNVASNSFAHGSKNLYAQTVKIAKMRAVENNRYFIQSSNAVSSFVIDNRGKMIYESPYGQWGITYARVTPIKDNSLYNKMGNWILLLSIIVITLFIYKKFPLKI